MLQYLSVLVIVVLFFTVRSEVNYERGHHAAVVHPKIYIAKIDYPMSQAQWIQAANDFSKQYKHTTRK